MIDLTPLDVRKKSEDFKRAVRGYDPEQVDSFLQMVAERLEGLVTEERALSERAETLQQQLERYQEREKALNEALLAAQELREEARSQAEREASLRLREAETHAEAILLDADQAIRQSQRRLDDMRARRGHLVRSLRGLLERFSEYLDLEEARLDAEPDDLTDLVERLEGDLVREVAGEVPAPTEGTSDAAAAAATGVEEASTVEETAPPSGATAEGPGDEPGDAVPEGPSPPETGSEAQPARWSPSLSRHPEDGGG